MRSTILGLLIVILFSVAGYATDIKMKFYENDKYHDVTISEVNGIKVSSDCLKKGKPDCEAWKAYLEKPKKPTKLSSHLLGNPAAQYCGDLKAQNRILKATDGSQSDYCVFDDGSMIDSWNIYNKHLNSK